MIDLFLSFNEIIIRLHKMSEISVNTKTSQSKKTRKTISLEKKIIILNRLDSGEKNISIAKSLNIATSTINTIKDNAKQIRESSEKFNAASAKKVSRNRSAIMESLEKLLIVWIDGLNQRNIPVSSAVIREKARSLHKDLTTKIDDVQQAEVFVASNGWLERFKKRHSFHNIKTLGEAASADVEAANNYPEELREIIDAGGYTHQQVYNVDETGLFWKCLPSRTVISRLILHIAFMIFNSLTLTYEIEINFFKRGKNCVGLQSSERPYNRNARRQRIGRS